MSNTLLLILASIILLFLIGLFFFFFRRRVELKPEEDQLLIKYPFKTKKITLDKELESWQLNKSYYIRWGIFYAVSMKLKSGKQLSVDSLFNQQKFDLLYNYLSDRFRERRKRSS